MVLVPPPPATAVVTVVATLDVNADVANVVAFFIVCVEWSCSLPLILFPFNVDTSPA